MRPVLAARVLSLALGLFAFCWSVGAATITVTNTNDSGAGSFRDAIDVSNASVGVLDTIAFNIAGAGVHTIMPATLLPSITDPVVIDGATQPGYAGSPLIEIKGSPIGFGLRVTAGASTVRALVINGFSTQIGFLTNGGNLVEGCYVGTDPTGTIGLSQGDGIYVQGSNGNTIGGTSAGACNLISGNAGAGFHIITGDANVIQGNRIGTTVDGLAALGNGSGVTIVIATNTLIGGAAAGARNLISGNSGNGITVAQSGAGNRIQGNWIGIDTSGTLALPNNFGIEAYGTPSLLIGGSAPGEGNVISGNNQAVFLNPINGTVIQGNLIGTDPSGIVPLPNNLSILLNTLDVTDVLIGGPAAGEGNVIAFNQGFATPGGILFTGGIWNLGLRVTIRGNSIHDNFGLGIDNSDGTLGINPNDPGDPDTGVGNEYQNFPIVTTVTVMGPEGINTRIQGVLHSTPSTIFSLDFYSNPACARFPREFLEGETYLGFGQTTTDGAGTGVFDVTLPVAVEPGARISATATDPVGNTSEFSQRIIFSILPTAGPPAGGTGIAISGTDFAAGATVAVGGAAASNVMVSSFTQMSATTPALAPGTVNDVTVTTDGSAGTLSKGWVADFLDVPPSQQFYSFVTTLVSNAITVGVGGGIYGVAQDTLRQQMAVFLLKAKFGLCYVPPPCTVQVFTDVPCSLSFAPWINELVAQGITGGCGDGTTYCPANPVLRQQMAVLLLRTLEGTAYTPPACVTATFADVPCSSPFAPWVYELVARNITAGCGGGNYCPTLSANRGQMATFIVKTFGLQ